MDISSGFKSVFTRKVVIYSASDNTYGLDPFQGRCMVILKHETRLRLLHVKCDNIYYFEINSSWSIQSNDEQCTDNKTKSNCTYERPG